MAKVPASKALRQEIASWTADMEKELCDLLVEQILLGNRPKSFVKSAWVHVKEEFNKKMEKNFSMEQIKNRYNLLRIRYNDFKKILERSGFSWNRKEKNVQASEGAWKAYLEEYPDHKRYKTSGCPIYEELCVVFGEKTASSIHRNASAKDKLADDVATHRTQLNVGRDDHETPTPTSRGSSAFIEEDEVGESSTRKTSDRGKRRSSTPHAKHGSRKESKTSELSDAYHALLAIADTTKPKYVGIDQKDPYSIPNCTIQLQSIEGVSIPSMMAALEKFQQPGWRQVFMSLKPSLQKEWLKSIEP